MKTIEILNLIETLAEQEAQMMDLSASLPTDAQAVVFLIAVDTARFLDFNRRAGTAKAVHLTKASWFDEADATAIARNTWGTDGQQARVVTLDKALTDTLATTRTTLSVLRAL